MADIYEWEKYAKNPNQEYDILKYVPKEETKKTEAVEQVPYGKWSTADKQKYIQNKYNYSLLDPNNKADMVEIQRLNAENQAIRDKYGATDEFNYEQVASNSNPYEKITDNNDYITYALNKASWDAQADKNSPYAKSLNAENQAIRDKYGIQADTKNAGMLQQYNQTSYPSSVRNSPEYQMWQEAVTKGDQMQDEYNANANKYLQRLDNFQYDPNTDASYQAYKKQYDLAGQNAYNSMLARNNAYTGGRANSYSNTQAANAQLAYANQVANALPQFMQSAYDRLANQYNNYLQSQQNSLNQQNNKISNLRDIVNWNYGVNQDVSDRLRQYGYDQRALQQADYQNALLDKELGYYDTDKSYEYGKSGAEIENINANTGLTNANIGLTNAKTEGQNLENYWYPFLSQAGIDNTNAQTNLYNAQTGKNTAQTNQIVSKTGSNTGKVNTVGSGGGGTKQPVVSTDNNNNNNNNNAQQSGTGKTNNSSGGTPTFGIGLSGNKTTDKQKGAWVD